MNAWLDGARVSDWNLVEWIERKTPVLQNSRGQRDHVVIQYGLRFIEV